jgi:PiT family inorganic phosphate transporter
LIYFFLLSGLFLGWSLGANDAANIFGTAVGTKMIRFRTAAIIASIFVVVGAVISGAGASHTLGKLGAVNALAGSFTVAFAAGLTVTWMTKLKLPVSTSQAIVGSIIGWNLFSGSPTDTSSLTKIVSTWIFTPILAAVFSLIIYKFFRKILNRSGMHLLELDNLTRVGLIVVGAFGAYSLGANNIANVMGVFVPSSPFLDFNINGMFTFSGTQQLFMIGGVAISIGIFTYSYKVMSTVGNDLFKLTPVLALIVVLAESLVLFIFSSQELEHFLLSMGLPSIPLVPVSSSQAVIGAVFGIAIAKGGRGFNYKVLGKISSGWITTPVISAIISFFMLFFMQNVFQLEVYENNSFVINSNVRDYLEEKDIILEVRDQKFESISSFNKFLDSFRQFSGDERQVIFESAKIVPSIINSKNYKKLLNNNLITENQYAKLIWSNGKSFHHKWEFIRFVQENDASLMYRKKSLINKQFNKKNKQILDALFEASINTKE